MHYNYLKYANFAIFLRRLSASFIQFWCLVTEINIKLSKKNFASSHGKPGKEEFWFCEVLKTGALLSKMFCCKCRRKISIWRRWISSFRNYWDYCSQALLRILLYLCRGGGGYEFITNLPCEITSKVGIFNCLNHPFKIFYNNFNQLFWENNTSPHLMKLNFRVTKFKQLCSTEKFNGEMYIINILRQ